MYFVPESNFYSKSSDPNSVGCMASRTLFSIKKGQAPCAHSPTGKQKQCEVRTARWRLSKRIRSIFLLLTRKKSEQDLPAEIHSGTLYERAPCPSNRIPRKFIQITGEMLIETTETLPGDIIRVYKNDIGYLGYNPRTNRNFYIFVSMLRNAEIFKLQEVLQ